MRTAITGIARAGTHRSPTAPRPPAAQNAASSAQPRPHRRPHAERPAPPSRPGRIARLWFGRTRRRPASPGRPPRPADDTAPFTPETHPELSPEACALLNTPVEDCDPEFLRLLLSALARHIADNLPPEPGMTDPQALFATLWARLADPLGDAPPDAAPDSPPPDAPARPTATAPTGSRPAPDTPATAPAAFQPAGAATTVAAAPPPTPDAVALPRPASRRRQPRRPDRRTRSRPRAHRPAQHPRPRQQLRPQHRHRIATGAGPP